MTYLVNRHTAHKRQLLFDFKVSSKQTKHSFFIHMISSYVSINKFYIIDDHMCAFRFNVSVFGVCSKILSIKHSD